MNKIILTGIGADVELFIKNIVTDEIVSAIIFWLPILGPPVIIKPEFVPESELIIDFLMFLTELNHQQIWLQYHDLCIS